MTTATLQTVSEADRRATWLELFFDLAFAAAIAEVGSVLSGDYSLRGLLQFGFLFLLIWSAWVGHTLFSSRFDTDDLVQRVLTLAQMFAVAVMAVNAEGPLGGRTSAGFAAAYAALRLVLMAQYLRARFQERARDLVTGHAMVVGAGAVVWLASAFIGAPVRFVLWGLALALDLGAPVVLHARTGGRPHHPAHLPERFGLFTLILLGESLAAMMTGMKHQEYWSTPAAAAAAAGIGVAFAIWWCYFHVLRAASPRPVQSPREAMQQRRWASAHLPLGLGIALTAIGVEQVIAHGGSHPLSREGTWVLSIGGAVVLAALAGLAGNLPGTGPVNARPGWALAGLVLAAGIVGTSLPPVLLLLLLLGSGLLLIALHGPAEGGAARISG